MAKRISSRRVRKKWDTFDVVSMTQRSSRGLYVLCSALLEPCTDNYLSVAFWLTRRLGLYDGPFLNLLRVDRVLIPVPSDCFRDSFSLWTWFRVQTARNTVYFNGCPYIFLIYYYITVYMYVCESHFYGLSALVGCWSSVSIKRIIYN